MWRPYSEARRARARTGPAGDRRLAVVGVALPGGVGDTVEFGLERPERRVLELALEAGLERRLGELGARHPLAGLWRGLCHRGLLRIASQRYGQAAVPGA